ncbi:ribosome biogenesis GTP-binding protein YihA/YsxC [Leptospirillum ferriphilum]|jgi:GTP-binding protein|nr:ribosome biogenesis GTP-binding protein YihA/YsxC [Leptospirillum ferriphilum]
MNPAKNKPSRILSAMFVRSLASPEDLPFLEEKAVIGFVGRSNVGKSSLINKLANRHHLAKVGRTPGKTTLANLYSLDKGGYFIDFPGYGYMRRDKETAQKARSLSTLLVEKMPSLQRILLLVDIRRDILPVDVEALLWLENLGRPVTIVLSKSDLVNRNDVQRVQKLWKDLLRERMNQVTSPPLVLSTKTGEGLGEIVDLLVGDLYPQDKDS